MRAGMVMMGAGWSTRYRPVAIEGIASSYDAVVVGAGPAGIMAAIEAAGACERVLVLEASALPREKSCGGMLNKYSLAALERFGGVPEEMILDPRRIAFRYYHMDREVKKPTDVRFLNVDRGMFDAWLLSLLPANVDVAARVRLAEVSQSSAAVTVRVAASGAGAPARRELSCRHLVAADGPRATVRELLRLRPFDRYISVQEYVRIEPGSLEPYFDCIYSHRFSRDYGIGYIIPKGDVAIIGSIFYPGTRECTRKHEEVLGILRGIYPFGEAVKRETWIAAHLTRPSDLVAGQGRILLAGEGGGFLSCTSGEGISFALNSGGMAGRAVAESVMAGSRAGEDALDRYERALRPLKRNLAFRMRVFPFMNSSVGKNLACHIPTPLVSRLTERV